MAGHPLLSAHAGRRRPALRLSTAVEPRRLSHSELYGDLLHPSGVEYAITIGVRADRREMLVAGLGRSERQFSERDRDVLDLVRPVLEHALRDARARERLDRALLLEEEVASFRPDALERLGLAPRETEVLCAAAAIEEEADIAWELCLSRHSARRSSQVVASATAPLRRGLLP